LDFQIPDEKNREWFIVGFCLAYTLPFDTQNIASQSEALEISMRLEASLVGKNGARMAQVQSQLVTLTI
jgi:hypothetical protein